MKKVLFVLFLLCGVIGSASAQTFSVEKYDSLSEYIEVDNLSKYINQNIYISKDSGIKTLFFSNFYCSLGGKLYCPDHITGCENNADSLCGRLFRIKSIGIYNNKKYMKLIDDSRKNKDSLFYIVNDNDILLKGFILYGYYIKIKELLLNKTFYGVTSRYDEPLKCDSVYMNEDFSDIQIKAKFNNGFVTDASLGIITSSNNYLAFKKEREEREKIHNRECLERKFAIEKYGNVCIGMRRDIVLKVCGDPDKINTTTTKYGKSEQFIYRDKQYIYIDNGKVSAIQDY